MAGKKDRSAVRIDDRNRDLKKFLWGANQNKKKMLSLAELTIATLKKAEKTLNKQEKDGPYKEQREFLKREIENIKKIKKTINDKSNRWPGNEKTEIKTRKKKIEPPTEKPGKEAGRILLIDDDTIILKMLNHFLVQNDYLVSFAMNAEDGLKKILAENLDLILLDIMMPGMDGYQFLKQLKSRNDTRDLPVIILSSLSRESDILTGLEYGAADYITKPFSPQVLISKINKILGSNRNK